MSEVGWYKSSIILSTVEVYSSNIRAHPCFDILKRSMEIVAQHHGGTLTDQVVDYNGKTTMCDIAVNFPEFPRGIGVKINGDTGVVTFVYDKYGGYEKTVQEITEEITQHYTSIAVIRAMKSMGYHVQEEKNMEQRTVTLVGVT